MLPLDIFNDNRRRRINLGGAATTTTQAAILDQAKARRSERLDHKRRQESAIRVQAWWRGIIQVRRTRQDMRRIFHDNVTNITGLRCLVLIGRDEEMLARWSTTMLDKGMFLGYIASWC